MRYRLSLSPIAIIVQITLTLTTTPSLYCSKHAVKPLLGHVGMLKCKLSESLSINCHVMFQVRRVRFSRLKSEILK